MPTNALATLLVCVATAGLSAPAAQQQWVAQPGTVTTRPDATAKRCLAAKRRVDRQREVVDELEARIAKDRKAREVCATRRACERLDRNLNAYDARRSRHARQLALYETEAARACER